MIINIILIAVIIAGITGIILCMKADKKDSKKKNPAAKQLALLMLLIIIASTFAILVRSTSPDDNEGEIVSEDMFYSRLSGLMLGKYLARNASGYNALVITHDKNSENALLDVCLDGLREGLEGKVKIAAIDFPVPTSYNGTPSPSEKVRISPERMLYISRKTQSKNFDQLIAKHPDCNLIISLICLPKDANKMIALNKKPEKRPKVALLSNNISMMKEMLLQGIISAAIISRPDYIPGKKKLPKNIETAFDKRFLMVTPDNVKSIAADYPSIFK
jgi:hypothetical protein